MSSSLEDSAEPTLAMSYRHASPTDHAIADNADADRNMLI